jgi:hypothetical protein
MRPLQDGGGAYPPRLGCNDPENSCCSTGERSTAREVIDPSTFCADDQGQLLEHRFHSGKAWHKT